MWQLAHSLQKCLVSFNFCFTIVGVVMRLLLIGLFTGLWVILHFYHGTETAQMDDQIDQVTVAVQGFQTCIWYFMLNQCDSYLYEPGLVNLLFVCSQRCAKHMYMPCMFQIWWLARLWIWNLVLNSYILKGSFSKFSIH